MKALLLLLVVLVGVWAWRHGRRLENRRAPPPGAGTGKAAAEPQDMVCCPVCALHLPRSEALAGRKGLYCSAAHRQQAEQTEV